MRLSFQGCEGRADVYMYIHITWLYSLHTQTHTQKLLISALFSVLFSSSWRFGPSGHSALQHRGTFDQQQWDHPRWAPQSHVFTDPGPGLFTEPPWSLISQTFPPSVNSETKGRRRFPPLKRGDSQINRNLVTPLTSRPWVLKHLTWQVLMQLDCKAKEAFWFWSDFFGGGLFSLAQSRVFQKYSDSQKYHTYIHTLFCVFKDRSVFGDLHSLFLSNQTTETLCSCTLTPGSFMFPCLCLPGQGGDGRVCL